MPILVKETPAKILYNPRIIPSFIATDRSRSTRLPLTFYHKLTLSGLGALSPVYETLYDNQINQCARSDWSISYGLLRQ